MTLMECPYDIGTFEAFGRGGGGHKANGSPAYLAFTRDKRTNALRVRLSVSEGVVRSMHECMDFDDRLEYRVSKSARAIALIPAGDGGVALSYPSKNRGTRCSISVCRASKLLLEMFGECHYVHLIPEYYDGVTIMRPSGKVDGGGAQ